MTRKTMTLKQLKSIATTQREGLTRPKSVIFSKEQDKYDRVNMVYSKTKKILDKI